MLTLDSSEKIAQFAIDPLSQSPLQGQHDGELGMQFTTKIALTLAAIWNLRNIVAHGRGLVNILSIINCLELRVHEHLASLNAEETRVPQGNAKWACLPSRVIKLNVNADVLEDHTRLVVVARDEYGKVIKA
jgi:hypothetical protein